MDHYYFVIIAISVFLMIIEILNVIFIKTINRKDRWLFVVTFLMIIIAALCEMTGQILDGADSKYRTLHIIVKVIEFSCVPIAPFLLSGPMGDVRIKPWMFFIPGINVVLEIISGFTGFIFTVSADNVYSHSTCYFIYMFFFVLTALMLFGTTYFKNKFKSFSHNLTITLIIVLMFSGVLIHQIIDEIRVDFLCMAISATMMHLQYSGLMLKEANDAYVNHIKMISGLSNDYTSIFLVNIKEDMALAYKKASVFNKNFAKNQSICYSEFMVDYIKHYVYKEDQKEMLNLCIGENIVSSFNENGDYRQNFRVIRNGVIFHYQVKAVRLEDDSENIIIGFGNVDDILREEIEKSKMLDKELSLAENANKSKTTFLSSMSHDIRTPMNSILGFTELAIKHVDEEKRVKDYLGKIKTSGNHLLSLINDVLDISRIEAGKLVLNEDTVSLKEDIKEVKDIIITSCKDKGIRFIVNIGEIKDDYVITDQLRLNQILLNCLSNAVKYTPSGGTVTLSMEEKEQIDEDIFTYQFRIKDTGIGMSKEFQEHIFEPYERSAKTTSIQGTGLGMTITKNIVDLMHGEIKVVSEVNQGSEFIITLYLQKAQEEHIIQNRDASEKIDFKGKRVLVVDDVDLNRELACEILKDMNIDPETASDGKQAIQKVDEHEDGYYSMILMDVQMPVMDGYEATRQIRMLDGAKAEIPIYALTGNAFNEDQKKAMDAGMNGHLAKPLDYQKLVEIFRKAFTE